MAFVLELRKPGKSGLLHFPTGQLGQGLADVGQGTHGLHTGVLQGGELLVRGGLTCNSAGSRSNEENVRRAGKTPANRVPPIV